MSLISHSLRFLDDYHLLPELCTPSVSFGMNVWMKITQLDVFDLSFIKNEVNYLHLLSYIASNEKTIQCELCDQSPVNRFHEGKL